MMHRAWSSIVEVPYCFSRPHVKFQCHTALKNRRIWPKLGVSGQQLQFEFTDGYEMLHKAWNSKGEVPYCFPRSSIKFQGHTGQNITDFDPNWAFPDYRPVAAFKSLRFALFVAAASFRVSVPEGSDQYVTVELFKSTIATPPLTESIRPPGRYKPYHWHGRDICIVMHLHQG